MNKTTYAFRRLSRAFVSQEGRCYWCKDYMQLVKLRPNQSKIPADAATLDHLYARGDPRRHDPSIERRLVAACCACNSRRGNTPPEAFAAQMLKERTSACQNPKPQSA